MTQSNTSADRGNDNNAKGAHPGYAGAGTFILKDGERVEVDPVTLKPLPKEEEPAPIEASLPAPEPVAEKTKPALKPVEKPAADANKPE